MYRMFWSTAIGAAPFWAWIPVLVALILILIFARWPWYWKLSPVWLYVVISLPWLYGWLTGRGS